MLPSLGVSLKTSGVGAMALGAIIAIITLGADGARAEPTVINFTQVGCQFIESEGGIDRGFTTRSAKDCERINRDTATKRLGEARPLVLRPGKYIFRVFNKNVPYALGFWVRGSGFGRVTLPSVSGGGLVLGKTQDYAITLKPGEYVYSCPLNPTPDYRLVVKG
ncbi:MAG: hypothetical protein V3T02_01870 [Alphaproteobacteria bacterium]